MSDWCLTSNTTTTVFEAYMAQHCLLQWLKQAEQIKFKK